MRWALPRRGRSHPATILSGAGGTCECGEVGGGLVVDEYEGDVGEVEVDACGAVEEVEEAFFCAVGYYFGFA